jgi:hypothetical protein
MKKVSLVVLGFSLVAIAGTSCAKYCNCTRYEDGKKIFVYTDKEAKFFEASVCEDQSVKPYQGLSMVTEGKEVTVEVKCK